MTSAAVKPAVLVALETALAEITHNCAGIRVFLQGKSLDFSELLLSAPKSQGTGKGSQMLIRLKFSE